MDFEFSDDQELLRDSVRRYLAERAPIAYVRDCYREPAAVDDVWRGLADPRSASPARNRAVPARPASDPEYPPPVPLRPPRRRCS